MKYTKLASIGTVLVFLCILIFNYECLALSGEDCADQHGSENNLDCTYTGCNGPASDCNTCENETGSPNDFVATRCGSGNNPLFGLCCVQTDDPCENDPLSPGCNDEEVDQCEDEACYYTVTGQQGCSVGYYCYVSSATGVTPEECNCAPCAQTMCGGGGEDACQPDICISDPASGCHCSECTNDDCNGESCGTDEFCGRPLNDNTFPCECISCTDTNCGGTNAVAGENCESNGEYCDNNEEGNWPPCTCRRDPECTEANEVEDCDDNDQCTRDLCLAGFCIHNDISPCNEDDDEVEADSSTDSSEDDGDGEEVQVE